jgi:CheY-like chemotaxis protein
MINTESSVPYGACSIRVQREVSMARILVVDDDPDIRNLVVRSVQASGHQVLGAGDANEALQVVRDKGAPEAVVLDVVMPDTDGLTLLRQLRAELGEDVPAVFLSGRVEPADIEAGVALGARYLTKPFVKTALLNALDTVLAEAAERRPSGW